MTVIRFPRLWRGADVSQPTGKFRGWLSTHRTSLWVVAGLLLIVGLVHGINFDGFPGRFSDDEGTYSAQAWSILTSGDLAHYQYWYDHPPFGWMQIAAYAWLTDGFDRTTSAVALGREVMLIADVISAALLYLLARRLRFGRVAASAAVLLFVASPVALFYHRMVFLDNIAVIWMLGAFAFAASPRRSLGAAFGCAVCFAGAVMSKETIVVVVPALIWMLWQHQPKGNRGWALGIFGSSFAGVNLLYPLYAVLKGELLEGDDHVSLLYAIKWQLFDRASSGSVFDSKSIAYDTVDGWFQLDWILLVSGAVVTLFALFMRRLRPIAVALAIQLVMLLRDGYLPQPYVIGLVPFAALLVAGMGDTLWKSRLVKSATRTSHWLWRSLRFGIGRTGAALVLAATAVFTLTEAPAWATKTKVALEVNQSYPQYEVVQWVIDNVPKDATLITDDKIWLDLYRAGYHNVVWMFKVDLDPAVKDKFFPNGYSDADYVIPLQLAEIELSALPIVQTAIEHADVVQSFGKGSLLVDIYKVKK